MKNPIHLALFSMLSTIFFSFGQEAPQDLELTPKDSIVISSSMLGLGFNVVDDSGDVFDELFSVDDQWNYVPYPSRISFERSTGKGLGYGAIASYNQYKKGIVIDGVVNDEETTYLSLDSRVSYDLNKLYNETSWFDPYVGIGLGYTQANDQARGTYNAVVGFRTWISERWGLDFNSSGKWAMGNNGATNHLQHAVGVLYQFDVAKGLSKKGEEKLALIQELQKEKQRVADSLATANRIEEEALLAKRLAEEKEKSRLAAEEQAKKDTENAGKQKILNEIEALGNAHFALNSSYLAEDAKKVLNDLSVILKTNKTVRLKITSHTDSRGTDKYNRWLSERRVKRTVDYLVALGIAPERLNGLAKGEDQLANHCDDEVVCTEEEHLENRRSEFEVVAF